MNETIKQTLALAALSMNLACLATSPVGQAMKAHGPEFTPHEAADGKAIVYVFRRKIFKGSGLVMKLQSTSDQGMECPLRNGGYRAYVVEPGPLTIETELGKGASITVEAEKDRPKFVRADIKMGFTKPKPAFEELSSKEGMEQIEDKKGNPPCKPIS